MTIVRKAEYELTPAERDTLRDILFKWLGGLGDQNERRWRGLWKRLLGLELGECFIFSAHMPRIGWYHRKHMLMEQRLFEAQEQFTNFEQFRNWLKIGAGFVDWIPDPSGTNPLAPIPKSISYAELEQPEFERFHADCLEFLRGPRAGLGLWPHLGVMDALQMIEDVIANAGSDQM